MIQWLIPNSIDSKFHSFEEHNGQGYYGRGRYLMVKAKHRNNLKSVKMHLNSVPLHGIKIFTSSRHHEGIFCCWRDLWMTKTAVVIPPAEQLSWLITQLHYGGCPHSTTTTQQCWLRWPYILEASRKYVCPYLGTYIALTNYNHNIYSTNLLIVFCSKDILWFS